MTKITYPQSSDVLVAIVRTEKQRYEVRLRVQRGYAYMYFVDESGISRGQMCGFVMLADVVRDIGRLESGTIKESELGVNAR